MLRSLFLRLGLSVNEASFAKGFLTVEALKEGLNVVAEMANRAREFLGEQVRATVEAGVAAEHMSKVLGISADQYQRLSYAARVSEVSQEALSAAMRKLAMGGSPDPISRMAQYADHIAGLTNPAARATYALRVLGRGGRDLIPMLEKGGAAFRQLMADADDLGAVMTENDIAAAKEYREEQTKLSLAMEGLRNRIVLPMLETLSKAFVAWTKLVIALQKWYATAKIVLPALKLIAVALAAIGVVLLANAAASFFAGASFTWFTTALIAATVAAWNAVVAFAAVAAPFVLWAVAVAAIILLLNDLYVFIEGGDSLIGAALHKWLGPFKTWRDGVKLLVQEVISEVEHAFGINSPEQVPDVPYVAPTEESRQAGKRGWFNNALHSVFGEAPQGIAPGMPGWSGGAASPTAASFMGMAPVAAQLQAPGGGPVIHQQIKMDIHPSPGMDERKLAEHAHKVFTERSNEQLRAANSAVGG